jgi:hypothetical protein
MKDRSNPVFSMFFFPNQFHAVAVSMTANLHCEIDSYGSLNLTGIAVL